MILGVDACVSRRGRNAKYISPTTPHQPSEAEFYLLSKQSHPVTTPTLLNDLASLTMLDVAYFKFASCVAIKRASCALVFYMSAIISPLCAGFLTLLHDVYALFVL